MEEQVVNSSAAAGGVLAAFFATLGVFAIVLMIAWYILQVIAYWKIFTKAGKPGWHSIIPFLQDWDEIDLSWNRTMAWVFLALILCSSILQGVANTAQSNGDGAGAAGTLTYIIGIAIAVIGIIRQYKLAKAFGRGIGFFIGLLLLNPIFKLILGFGDSQYQGRQG